jgi:hypothetical protein
VKRGGYIRRKTPLPPPSKPMRRTRIKRISKDERKRQRDNELFLAAYRRDHPACECGDDCGCPGEEIHEIAAGAQHRWKCRTRRSCLLHLFHDCHKRCQGEPYARGLARKLLSSPDEFDIAEFLRVIGRARTAVTINEVLAELAAMPKQPPSLDECKSLIDHWDRKVLRLTQLLDEAEQNRRRAEKEFRKAEAREKKITESQFIPDAKD